jgi:hypothetical protein
MLSALSSSSGRGGFADLGEPILNLLSQLCGCVARFAYDEQPQYNRMRQQSGRIKTPARNDHTTPLLHASKQSTVKECQRMLYIQPYLRLC